ncbi:uncharacterized protein [Ptychodera flava]|uniref:uncharacterized protein n=1 Tax=Ptychodera flava TaxID=63121 RepID=UPI003969CCEE
MKDGEEEGKDEDEEVEDVVEDGNETLVSTSGLDKDDEKDVDEEMQEEEDGVALELESLNQESQEALKTEKKKSEEPAVCADVPIGSPAKPGARETASTPASQVSNLDNDEQCITRCPCGCNEEDGLMINCEACNYWQHAICFGMLEEDEVPDVHICDLCADANIPDRKPTDYTLYGMKPVNIQAMCLWRRALLACTEINRLIVPQFAKRLGVEISVAHGLVNRLQKEKFVIAPNKGKRLGKIVRKEKVLEEGYKMYCKRASTPEEAEEMMETKENSPKQDSQRPQERDSQKRKQDDEMEELAQRASTMDVSGKPGHGRKVEKPKRLQELISQRQVRHSPRLQKRKFEESRKIVSTADHSEYEISNSQDMDDFSMNRTSKRRKASTVTRTIMV